MLEALDPRTWQHTGQRFEFDGLRLFVNVQGRGQPVLTLHAFPTSSYDFSRLVPLLRDRFQFILFDYPGFGFSDKPPRYPYSLFKYADVAQAVAQHFGMEHMPLVAHDIGDSVALELLRRGQPIDLHRIWMTTQVLTDTSLLPLETRVIPYQIPLLVTASLPVKLTVRLLYRDVSQTFAEFAQDGPCGAVQPVSSDDCPGARARCGDSGRHA